MRAKAWHLITSSKILREIRIRHFWRAKDLEGDSRMSSEYFHSLEHLAQRVYLENLKIDGEVLPDPFSISQDLWKDDMTQWPDLLYGDVYSYLIETKGPYTKEKLRAYKSLDAFNYFVCGHVRTVYCHCLENYVVLKAFVNPSQKTPDKPHSAWLVVHKESAEVKTGHCTCMAG